jgi:MFS family permease
MAVIGAASVLASLDLFVVNLAFSSIGHSFPGTTDQGLSWVLNAYGILFAALLVPAGRLADRFGRRRVFRIGLAIFTLGSVVSPAAPDVAVLVIGRAIQGAGAALLVPTSLGLLLAAYPKPRHQQMVSIWAAMGSVAAALGPVLGGLLVEADWRLIFAINIPIAVPAIVLARRLQETPKASTRVPDLFGSALLAVSVGLLVAALCYAPGWGAGSPTLWAVIAGAVVLFAAFAYRCIRMPSPAVDLRVFRVRSFTVATAGMACFYIGFAIMLLGGSLYLTQVWRWSPVLAGLGFGVGPATAAAAALIAGKLNLRPQALAVSAGIFLAAAGIFWLASLGIISNYPLRYLPGLILSGTGAGIGQTAFLSGGTARLAAGEYSAGTGVLNTARQIGTALGVAILVGLTGSALHPAQYHSAWAAMAAAGLIAAAAAARLSSRAGGKHGQDPDSVPAALARAAHGRERRSRPPSYADGHAIVLDATDRDSCP